VIGDAWQDLFAPEDNNFLYGSKRKNFLMEKHTDNKLISVIYRWLMYLILLLLPLFIGGARPWLWSWAAVASLLALIPGIWLIGPRFLFPRSPLFWIAVGPLIAWTLFLTVPLPDGFLAALSPHRANLAKTASNLLGLPYYGATLSYDPQVGILYWGFVVSLAAFGLMVRQVLAYPQGLRDVLRIFWIMALFQVGYGLLQVLIPSLGVLWAEAEFSHISAGRARGSLINFDHYAFFLNILWPLCLAYTLLPSEVSRRFRTRRKTRLGAQAEYRGEGMARQGLLLFAVGLMALALFFSLSRGGILAFFAALATFVLLIPRKRKWLVPVTLAGMGVVVLVYGYTLGFESLVQRFLQLESAKHGRLEIWRDAWRILKDHPLGIGLGNFSVLYPLYQVQVTAPVKYSHAHNDILQLAIEVGLPAWVCLFSGFFYFLARAMKRLRRLLAQDDAPSYYLAVGSLSGLVAATVHSSFDFSLQIPSNAFYLVVLLSLVQVGTGSRSKTSKVESGWNASAASTQRLASVRMKLVQEEGRRPPLPLSVLQLLYKYLIRARVPDCAP
jgi:O-antigen ligase